MQTLSIVLMTVFSQLCELVPFWEAGAQMTEHAGLRAVISKAQIIDELEDGLPSWAKRLGGTAWYPSYVHVLKVRSNLCEPAFRPPCACAQDLHQVWRHIFHCMTVGVLKVHRSGVILGSSRIPVRTCRFP